MGAIICSQNEQAIQLLVQDLREEVSRIEQLGAFGTLELSIGFEGGRSTGAAKLNLMRQYRLGKKRGD